ncbi:MAG: tetratricopeptide repeat protein [Bacteroidetes bacterium]|nr:tetratricopeptide repeat protein [Bacteroidota bacterium]
MKYTFAIDETGGFTFDRNQKSFVCGVLTSTNEYNLKQKYQEVYQQIFNVSTAPDTTVDLIGSEKFHYTKLNPHQKSICKTELLAFAEKIWVSTGMPLLFANNQNYWQIAVTAVITGLFKTYNFVSGDEIDVLIDARAGMVLGTLEYDPSKDEKDVNGKTIKYDDENRKFFKKYHELLKEQFERIIQPFQKSKGLKIKIAFASDTKSFFVNLADIVCGLVREDKDIPTIKCPCEKVFSEADPQQIYKNNPLAALNIIFQKFIKDGGSSNIPLISTILEANRSDDETNNHIWDGFYSFLKYQINHRYEEGNLHQLISIRDLFLSEFEKHHSKIKSEKQLDSLTLFIEYASHNGETKHPFEQDFVLKMINENQNESRLLRKWEKWISYHLRTVQIHFNAYNFITAEKNFSDLWSQQETITKAIPFDNKKDEHTTAILGTLAQSYAYNGKLKEATDYFELSSESNVKTSAQTYSYLFSCYFGLEDLDKARTYFEELAGCKPEEFSHSRNKYVWQLLAYTKLRALELHKLKSTQLPEVLPHENAKTKYPYPLVLKWLSVALFMEDKEKNKEKISTYLNQGIEELLKASNGFTIKTLALPLIQLFALVDNGNPYHNQYNKIVADLIKDNEHFSIFIENSDCLHSIKNNANYWQRANALPFIYS